MAQFSCEVCGEGFSQRSRLERHVQTSHPPQAPSAADVEAALAGIELPADRRALVSHAEAQADEAVVEALARLPDRTYRDAAEVTRALSEVRRHEPKPTHQPSRRGGARALEAPSAARIAELLRGVTLPATGAELRAHARARADAEEMAQLERLGEGPYADMAEVAKALARPD